MSDPYVGEIRLMSFDFTPTGWAQCNGQLLPINQNTPLFALLGTTYGGNGQTTFGLPDLRGRVPISFGTTPTTYRTLGERGGEAAHTLTLAELPSHTHPVSGTQLTATTATPTDGLLAAAADQYAVDPAATTTLAPDTITSVGNGQSHENRQPFLTLNFCISLRGVFPSRT